MWQGCQIILLCQFHGRECSLWIRQRNSQLIIIILRPFSQYNYALSNMRWCLSSNILDVQTLRQDAPCDKLNKSYPFPVFQFQHESHSVSLGLKGNLPHCSHLTFQNTEMALPKNTRFMHFLSLQNLFKNVALCSPGQPLEEHFVAF